MKSRINRKFLKIYGCHVAWLGWLIIEIGNRIPIESMQYGSYELGSDLELYGTDIEREAHD